MGLGRADHDGRTGGVTLAVAWQRAADAQRLLSEGKDPLESASGEEAIPLRRASEAAEGATFEAVAVAFVAMKRAEWKNAKHAYQWEATLRSAFPVIGKQDVAEITPDDVFAVLNPIWTTKTETASRLRQRIEAVLDHAEARGLRTGKNPASWKGNLKYRLAAPAKVKQRQGGEQPQPALAWKRMPDFWSALQAREDTVSRLALEFLIFTTLRSSVVRSAPWSEFSLAEGVWTIPAERMKLPREHRAPLTSVMCGVLERAQQLNPPKSADLLVFPGARKGHALSDMALNMVVRGMNEEAAKGNPDAAPFWHDPVSKRGIVPHGFRSTFFDFGEDASEPGTRVLDACLAMANRTKCEEPIAEPSF